MAVQILSELRNSYPLETRQTLRNFSVPHCALSYPVLKSKTQYLFILSCGTSGVLDSFTLCIWSLKLIGASLL